MINSNESNNSLRSLVDASRLGGRYLVRAVLIVLLAWAGWEAMWIVRPPGSAGNSAAVADTAHNASPAPQADSVVGLIEATYEMQDLLDGAWEFASSAWQVTVRPVSKEGLKELPTFGTDTDALGAVLEPSHSQDAQVLSMMDAFGAIKQDVGQGVQRVLTRGELTAVALSRREIAGERLLLVRAVFRWSGRPYELELRPSATTANGDRTEPSESPAVTDLPVLADFLPIATRLDTQGHACGILGQTAVPQSQWMEQWQKMGWKVQANQLDSRQIICQRGGDTCVAVFSSINQQPETMVFLVRVPARVGEGTSSLESSRLESSHE